MAQDWRDLDEEESLQLTLQLLAEFQKEDAEYDTRDSRASKDTEFWKLYIATKPRGTLESWNEDIGVPPLVLTDVWNFAVSATGIEGVTALDVLWLLTWMRKHAKLRSTAVEWNTDKSTFRTHSIRALTSLLVALGDVRLFPRPESALFLVTAPVFS